MQSPRDPLLDLVGRLHVVLVHFPVALILAAALFELARRRLAGRPRSSTAFACLWLGWLGALAAVGSGWLLAEAEPARGQAASTLALHRWFGVAGASTATLALLLGAATRGRVGGPLAAYRLVLLVAAAVVGTGAHFGGTLVHGRGYLLGAFERREPPRVEDAREAPSEDAESEPDSAPDSAPDPAPGPADALDPADGRVDYERDVKPILAASCYECHGPERSKGGLRLDDMAELFAFGADEWLIVPGRPMDSELFVRVTLPVDDVDHMPEEGDPLDARQVATLRAWIEQGAGGWQATERRDGTTGSAGGER